jgi:type II secretory pathway pseudopilin PulG
MIEALLVVAMIGILLTIAVPIVRGAADRLAFQAASRAVGAEIRATRYAAVAKNRSMALRFNCPVPGQYRMVEVTGNAAIDNAADRCSETAYPFPDTTPNAPPNADGPVKRLPPGITFTQSQTLIFTSSGRLPAAAAIVVSSGGQNRNIALATSGRVVE